ncbi:hypothetical protein THAOC_15224 [Thalassiosira oceanica]|uniref:Uncharacterized protein n=1 Tax=Thalassiosira oceanica TaxID=159749 RepID=K0SD95_THAOC|nr:hypothetical protein THAOC_15224 [Thalassiosira oceanica]|eukprot:EJK64078.1 hypothetical protein THAOC_15224 [Thalassiosira oceanica]
MGQTGHGGQTPYEYENTRYDEPIDDNDVWSSAMKRFQVEQVESGEQFDQGIIISNDAESWENHDFTLEDHLKHIDRIGEDRSDRGRYANGKEPLWTTFTHMLRTNPLLRFYLCALIILLATAILIIAVSVSHPSRARTAEECHSRTYSDIPTVIRAHTNQGNMIQAGAFGYSLATTSEYLVAGAPRPDCLSEACADHTLGGATYIYRKDGGTWRLTSSFVLDNGSHGDEFGRSVSIDEDALVIVASAPKDDTLGVSAGAMYVIHRPFETTKPPERLTPLDLSPNDEFGANVGVSRTTLKGLFTEVGVTNIVASSSSDEFSSIESGSVYLFSKFDAPAPPGACGGIKIIVGYWTQCQKLTAGVDAQSFDRFGSSVALYGNTLAVGAKWSDDLKNTGWIDTGAVYLYALGYDGNWRFHQKLESPSPGHSSLFGSSVSIGAGRLVVGAPLDDTNGYVDSGCSYVYKLKESGQWELETRFIPDSGSSMHRCGSSVSMSNDGKSIVIGCSGDESASLYAIEPQYSTWTRIKTLSVKQDKSNFGASVALTASQDEVIVGYGSDSDGSIYSFQKGCRK